MLSLNIPLQELFGLFRRPQLLATHDWQLHHNNASAYAPGLVWSVLVKCQTTKVTQPPPTTQILCPAIYGFSQN